MDRLVSDPEEREVQREIVIPVEMNVYLLPPENRRMVFPLNIQTLRLPRLVELDPRAPRVLRSLAVRTRPLWEGGALEIPLVKFDAALAAALRSAQSAGRVVRGLENARRRLAAEERGLRMADQDSGAPRGLRVSRLLVLSNDGAQRFYRHVETLLFRHGHRMLAVCIDVDADTLGELLFGPGRPARLILIEHKEAVCVTLLALAGQGEDARGQDGHP